MRISFKEENKKTYEAINFRKLSNNILFWTIALNYFNEWAQHSAVWNRKMQ